MFCRQLSHEITKKAIKAADCVCMNECITFQNVSQMHTKIQALVQFKITIRRKLICILICNLMNK